MKKKVLLFLVMSSLFLIGGGGFKLNAQSFDITYGTGDAAFTLTYTPIDGSTCSVKCTKGNGPSSSTEITIPQTVSNGTSTYIVTTIPEFGFDGASSALNGQEDNFTKLVLPNTITSIGKYAFYGWANLDELHLGTSKNSNSLDIATYAFNSTKNITTIYCYYTTPPHINDVNGSFDSNVRDYANLYVPESSIDSYKNYNFNGNTLVWCKFKNISKIVDSEPRITLTADQTTIIANGNNATTFTVTSNVDGDVTNSCTIYQVNGTEDIQLPSNTFSTTEAGTYQFYATYGDLQSETITVTANEQTLSLSATPTTIVANGNETTTFTVKLDGETINSGYQIYKGTDLHTGSTFSTTEAGTYTFYATYTSGTKTLTSNTVSITANEQTLTLEANPTEIVADGTAEVTFTVKLDGGIINSGYQIYKGTDSHTGNTFSTTEAGTYTFYATYNTGVKNLTSGNVTVTATEPEVDPDPEQPSQDGDVVEIGEGSNSSAKDVPVNDNYEFSISQQIYRSSEIGKDDGIITKIAFATTDESDSYPDARKWDVYMVNTTDSNFGKSADNRNSNMKPMTSDNIVYSGDVTLTKNNLITIELQEPFIYEGNNILVCVNDKTNDYASGHQTHFKVYNSSAESLDGGYAWRVLKKQNTKSVYDPTSVISASNSTNVPSIQLTFAAEEPADPITLSTIDNKTEIIANGKDAITFFVTQGEGTGTNVITDQCEIHKVAGTGSEIVTNPFTTTTAGTYQFFAKKGNSTSETITITAREPQTIVELKYDKNSIWPDGNDAVTFTVMKGIEGIGATEEITADYEIYVNDVKIDGNVFTTTEAGTYTAYAMYNGKKSEPVSIAAQEWKVVGFVDRKDILKIYPDDNYENVVKIISTSGFELWVACFLENNNGIILNNNYIVYGDELNPTYEARTDHRPSTPAPLAIPETIELSGIGTFTIAEIKSSVFHNQFDGYKTFGNDLNNNISELTLPSTITTIGSNAFNFTMSEGFKLTCLAETPPTIQDHTFGTYSETSKGNYKKAVLQVPLSSVEAYQSAEYWERFAKIGAESASIPTFAGNGDWANAEMWSTGIVPEDGAIVKIEGEAHIYTDVNTGEMTIEEGASVIIEDGGILYTDDEITNNGNIIIEDGGQLYYDIEVEQDPNIISVGSDFDVTVKKGIKGYGDDDNVSHGWYTISTPTFTVEDNFLGYSGAYPISDISNLIPTNNNIHYDLYRYYEMGDIENSGYWENSKQGDSQMSEYGEPFESLTSGRGYLYACSEDVTLEFTGKIELKSAINVCTTNNENEDFRGFNLIGNPFTHNITTDNIKGYENDLVIADGFYTVTNAGTWETHLSTEQIKPTQGALIKVIGEITGEALLYSIDREAQQPTTSKRNANNGSLAISVTNGKYNDNAFVSFSDGHGLNKFPHLSKEAHEVYVNIEDTKYAVATMNQDVNEIPVCFEAKTMGQYTINVKANDCKFDEMILIDRMTGIKTNLNTGSYTFMATANDNPERFVITLDSDTDIDSDFIYINNNEIIINNIEGDGSIHIFDIMGRPLAEYNANGSANINIETFAKGVYIVRMTDDNGVMTQKIVLN